MPVHLQGWFVYPPGIRVINNFPTLTVRLVFRLCLPGGQAFFLHAGKESPKKWKQVRKSLTGILFHPFTGEMINVAVFTFYLLRRPG